MNELKTPDLRKKKESYDSELNSSPRPLQVESKARETTGSNCQTFF